MASSRVMSTSTTTNSDLQVPSSTPPPQISSFTSISIPGVDHSKNLPSVTMDDILKNIYVDALSPEVVFGNGDIGGYSNKVATGNDVWKGIVAGTGEIGGVGAGMTLEEYLSKAGVGGGGEGIGIGNGNDEVVRATAGTDLVVFGGVETSSATLNQFQQSHHGLQAQQVVEGSGLAIGNGIDGRVVGGRGKRKAVMEPVVDKATQQKHKRMIKNRESAARSRERKQQYNDELEKQVMQLEEEKAQHLKEMAEERNRIRQWIIEKIIPIEEKPRQPRRLRRTISMEW
ncbi:hypothetical protein QQ045_012496 [Rhodiola kirilowii]